MCFIVRIQLELLTIILHHDKNSKDQFFDWGEFGWSFSDPEWILPNTYSSYGVSVHALLITLTLFEMLGFLKLF